MVSGQDGRHSAVALLLKAALIQSVPITTKVVNLNPADGEVYSIV
jgi:hypothetical protein